jgi:hypothetical protein
MSRLVFPIFLEKLSVPNMVTFLALPHEKSRIQILGFACPLLFFIFNVCPLEVRGMFESADSTAQRVALMVTKNQIHVTKWVRPRSLQWRESCMAEAYGDLG